MTISACGTYAWRGVGDEAHQFIVGVCQKPDCVADDQRCDAQHRGQRIYISTDKVGHKIVELKDLSTPPAQGTIIELLGGAESAKLFGGCACSAEQTATLTAHVLECRRTQ